MSDNKNVLMIGTNDIDCFFGMANAFDKKLVRVIQVHSETMAVKYLKEQSFDAIIVNLEPDGRGGIRGIDVLPAIIDSEKNQDAICFSISAVSATALLSAQTELLNTLSIIVGWLNLPVEHNKAVNLILDIVSSDNKLRVRNRLPR